MKRKGYTRLALGKRTLFLVQMTLKVKNYQLNIKSHVNVHKITDETCSEMKPAGNNRHSIPVCFTFSKTNGMFTMKSCKAIRSHSSESWWFEETWVTAAIKLSSVTCTRAVTWCDDFERLYPGNCAQIHTSAMTVIHSTGRFTVTYKSWMSLSGISVTLQLTELSYGRQKMFINCKSMELVIKYSVNKLVLYLLSEHIANASRSTSVLH